MIIIITIISVITIIMAQVHLRRLVSQMPRLFTCADPCQYYSILH